MASGPDLLLKILKDNTRRKILLLLNEKRNITYTDLMNSLNIVSTGRLNYHLKVLDDLLTKNETGHYLLTEKGKLAARLLLEFPEPEKQLKTKKKYWKRFWFVAIILQFIGFAFSLVLYFFGYLDVGQMLQVIVGLPSVLIFLYFYYRMLRPPSEKDVQKEPPRTIRDILVSGKNLKEVREEVLQWVEDEKITIELDHEAFIRGRLGTPSGLDWTAPKYFEVLLRPDSNGVKVHTEGWITMMDVSERCFSKSGHFIGLLPRRKGWIVMEKLWKRLENMAN